MTEKDKNELIGKRASHQRSDEKKPKVGTIRDVMIPPYTQRVKEVELQFEDGRRRWVSLSLVKLLEEVE